MLKVTKVTITMRESRPAPGGSMPCYLEGMTYVLETEAEIAMAAQFIEEGAAVFPQPSFPELATGGLVTGGASDGLVTQSTETIVSHEIAEGLRKMAATKATPKPKKK